MRTKLTRAEHLVQELCMIDDADYYRGCAGSITDREHYGSRARPTGAGHHGYVFGTTMAHQMMLRAQWHRRRAQEKLGVTFGPLIYVGGSGGNGLPSEGANGGGAKGIGTLRWYPGESADLVREIGFVP